MSRNTTPRRSQSPALRLSPSPPPTPECSSIQPVGRTVLLTSGRAHSTWKAIPLEPVPGVGQSAAECRESLVEARRRKMQALMEEEKWLELLNVA